MSGRAVPVGARGVLAAARPLPQLACAPLTPTARSHTLGHAAAFKMGEKKGKKEKWREGGEKTPAPVAGGISAP